MKPCVQVICESSGGYERKFVQALARAQVPVSLVQANRVRQYARAAGILAKTDRLDAQVLCEFGRVMRPQRITAATLEQEHLRELESQRRHLTQSAGDGAKSQRPNQRCRSSEAESTFDQPNQKAGRAPRSTH